MVSCGPSLEEKAKKIALRDSASIDSALKKEEAQKRILVRHSRKIKDSIRRRAFDSVLLRKDSLIRSRLSADSLLNSKSLNIDSIRVHKLHHADSGRRYRTDTSLLHKRRQGLKLSQTNKHNLDSDTFSKFIRLHKRNAVDSLHKKRPVKISTTADSSIQ